VKAKELLPGVLSMKESSAYQAIFEERRKQGLEETRAEARMKGAVAEARKLVRLVGGNAFGEPDARTAAIERLDDLGRLEDLLGRVRTAGSWQELLGRVGTVNPAELFPGIVSLIGSSTFHAILEEGEMRGAIREARKLLRLVGDEAFGDPDDRTTVAIESLNDLARLEALYKQIRTASSWRELLGLPAPRRDGGRRHEGPMARARQLRYPLSSSLLRSGGLRRLSPQGSIRKTAPYSVTNFPTVAVWQANVAWPQPSCSGDCSGACAESIARA
jgi:hypothetical protein